MCFHPSAVTPFIQLVGLATRLRNMATNQDDGGSNTSGSAEKVSERSLLPAAIVRNNLRAAVAYRALARWRWEVPAHHDQTSKPLDG